MELKYMIKKMLLLLLFLPIYLFAWKMESDTATLERTSTSHSWTYIPLNQEYDEPPLIFALLTDEGGHATALRIQNITTNSFEAIQVEPESYNGKHGAMDIYYIAIEAGEHTLPNGTKIIAGTHDTNSSVGKNDSAADVWDTISFSSSFGSAPVVLAMIQGLENEENNIPIENPSPWLTTAVSVVSNDDFLISLERSETNTGSVSNDETIAYLAIDSSAKGSLFDTSCNAVSYEAILTPQSVDGWDDGCDTFNFTNLYTATPHVIATKNTHNENDGGWLRRCSIDASSVGLTVDEDTAADNERNHSGESAGIFVASGNFTFDLDIHIACFSKPIAEYRMDECYWSHDIGDVKDSGASGYDATSYNAAVAMGVINNNNAGHFTANGDHVQTEDPTVGDTSGELSVSFWVKLDQEFGNWTYILGKTNSWNWNNGWGFVDPTEDPDGSFRFFIDDWDGGDQFVESTLTVADGWVHFVGTYDGTTIKLYKDSNLAPTATNSGLDISSSDPFMMAHDGSGVDSMKGLLDEVKIWDTALSADEVKIIFENESDGKNYDGTDRNQTVCSASIAAQSWELIGIPADLRSESYTVADIFDEISGNYGCDFAGGDDWCIKRRDYSATDNSSWYTDLTLTTVLEFGKGYWLGSRNANTWDINDLTGVDYNSTHADCTANRCIEIDLRSVTKNFGAPDNDPNDGSGPYRYNMSGYIGKMPVKWEDCRFIINGVAYTPTQAEENDPQYASKQIWTYNSSSGMYDPCDDTMSACILKPYKGLWIELHGATKNETVKLLIPQE